MNCLAQDNYLPYINNKRISETKTTTTKVICIIIIFFITDKDMKEKLLQQQQQQTIITAHNKKATKRKTNHEYVAARLPGIRAATDIFFFVFVFLKLNGQQTIRK